MISSIQYRRLYKMINQGSTLNDASAKAGIDPKTAREYLKKITLSKSSIIVGKLEKTL